MMKKPKQILNFIDYDVEKEWLLHKTIAPPMGMRCTGNIISLQELTQKCTESLTWKTFHLLTGKQIDLSKRIGKKIRVFRDGGNVYVSDHEWIVGETYKNNELKARVSHISAKGEALMENLKSRLNVITSTKPLNWTIE